MRLIHQAWLGILASIVSGSVVVGSLLLSLVEGGLPLVTGSTQAIISNPSNYRPSPIPEILNALPMGATPTPTVTDFPLELSPTLLPPTPSACIPPAGWIPLAVQPGDTLQGIAKAYHLALEELATANCLQPTSTNLQEGIILYVPDYPPTPTPVLCGPPPGWVIYIVHYGDTLYQISRAVGTSIADLQLANCMGNSTFIRTGQALYVPFIPALPPTWLPTDTIPATLPPVDTPTSSTNDTPYPTPTAPPDPGPTVPPSPTAALPPTATALPPATEPVINPASPTIPVTPTDPPLQATEPLSINP